MNIRAVLACGAGLMSLVAVPFQARAQEEAQGVVQEDADAPQHHAPAAGAGDIIVTARRVAEKLQDIPLAVTALSGEALAAQGVRQLTDLSATVPNLNIVGANADAQTLLVTIRGQNAANSILTTDNSVGLYIDGVNVPRTYGLRAGLVDMQRVEVLRGPQGTLYGRNTTGGAISFITKDPNDELGGQVQATLGNYDLRGVTGILNLPVTDGVGVRFVAVRSKRDGFGRSPITDRQLMSDDSTYLRGKLKVDKGDFTVSITGDYQRNNAGGLMSKLTGLTASPTSSIIREAAAETFGTSTPDAAQLAAARTILESYIKRGPFRTSYGYGNSIFGANSSGVDRRPASRSETWSAALNVDYNLSDSLTLRSITGYRNVKKFSTNDYDGTPFIVNSSQLSTKDDFFSEEFQLLGEVGSLNYVAGLFYSYEDGTEKQEATSLYYLNNRSLTVFDGDITSKSYAVFGQANWNFAPGFSLTVGARYTKEVREFLNRNRLISGAGVVTYLPPALNADGTPGKFYENTFKKPTWLASLDYKISDDVLVYGKITRGFRGGGQQQRSTTLINAVPFGPEIITEYEIGLKSQFFDRRLTLNLAGFYDDYTDIQRTLLFATDFGTGTLLTNASKARLMGFEGEATLRVTDELTLRASVGTFDPKYKDYVDAANVDHSNEPWPAPTTNYQLGADFRKPVGIGEFAANVNWSWQSDFNTYPSAALADQVTQKGYGLLSGKLGLSIDAWNADISVFGRNLLAKKYYNAGVSLEALGFNTLAAGDPRTFGVLFIKRFGGE
ncbi:TonB-dependent receptor [Novosphingobium resinovorum]|uniref:TonB-dependent receptor n=1 Tax=Novosphingobium resinovorum TaxID=158500 RepID=UPI000B07C370|nr:TonB-dependent receptor [Novosphingobium resinovorum]